MDFEKSQDRGACPVVMNLHTEILCNQNFRTTIWTGKHLQVTVMSVPSGGEIGLEMHDDLDQFLRIENGCAAVYMGKTKQSVSFVGTANQNCAIIIPAGTWHNIVNASTYTLKLYSIYAPPQHPFGTIHATKLDSDKAEEEVF